MFNYVGTPLELGDLESKTLNHGRFYKLDAVWVPSVTTVVGHQSKQGILDWENRIGYTEAEKIRRAAAWRGTKYHSIVEYYLRNESEKIKESKGLAKYLFGASREVLNRISNIHSLETPLYSRNLYLAGRVDCIAEFDNELAVIDFKTTGTLKKEKYLEKYFVQEAAYAYMYWELTGVEVDKLVTISVAEDGQTQVVEKYDKVPYINTLIDCIKDYRYYTEGLKS